MSMCKKINLFISHLILGRCYEQHERGSGRLQDSTIKKADDDIEYVRQQRLLGILQKAKRRIIVAFNLL